MKNMKKIMALAIALVMCMMMSATAFAATITVTTPTDGTPAGTDYSTETYSAYKIFDAVLSSGTSVSTDDSDGVTQTLNPTTGAISYQITDTEATAEWFDVLFQKDDEGNVSPKSGQNWVVASPTGTENVYQIKAAGDNGAALGSKDEAKAFATWLLQNKGTITGTTLVEGSNTVGDGYYLITSSLGTNLGLATTNIPMTIVEKNQYPTVDKEVATTDEVAQIGKDVTFTITVTVPNTVNDDIYLTDEMSSGLTFKEITSVKNNNDPATDVTYSTLLTKTDESPTTLSGTNVATNSNKFVVKIAKADAIANKGKSIIITYKATVNKNAIVSAVDTDDTNANTNKVTFDYSQYSQTDIVDVNTTDITLLKYDGAVTDAVTNNTSLAGATFELRDSSGNVISLVAEEDDTTTTSGVTYQTYHVADGLATETIVTQVETTEGKVIRVKGLDSDLTYTWVEIEAPDGYNMADTDTNVTPAADTLLTRTNIVNNKGTVLPSTGGIGTTIFYVIGAVLVIGAGVLLVTRRRMRAE